MVAYRLGHKDKEEGVEEVWDSITECRSYCTLFYMVFPLFKVGLWLLYGVAEGKRMCGIPFKLAHVGVACGVRLQAYLKMGDSE